VTTILHTSLAKLPPIFILGASYVHCRYSDRTPCTAQIQDFWLTRRDAVQHDLFTTNQSSEVWT